MPKSQNPSDGVLNDDKGVVEEEEEEEEEEQNNSSSTTKSSNNDGDDDDDDEIRTKRLTQQNTALKAEINRYKAMAVLTMYSQSMKLREKELQLFLLKEENSEKDDELEKVLRKKISRGC